MIRTALPFRLVQSALLAALFMFWAGTVAAFAESGTAGDARPAAADSGLQVIPLAQYQLLSLESQTVHSPGAGIITVAENLVLVGLYSRHWVPQELEFKYTDTYHSVQLMADGKHARHPRHQYLGFFKSESDRPVAGGLRTFQAAAAYGYQVVEQPNFTLVLGGGLAVSDFGIKGPGGDPWPLIPVPLIRAEWESRLLKASLDFMTGPNLGLTFAPESRLRGSLDVRVDQFRDERDLIFETALIYRFFTPEHRFYDLAGVALGVKSDVMEFKLAAEDESLELQYYALFGTLDLTLLTLTGGYAFDSRIRYRERDAASAGEGWFVSVTALVPLGGSHNDR